MPETSSVRRVIDSHLDLSWSALSWNRDLTQSLSQINKAESQMTDHRGRGRAVVCFPEMRKGNVALCLGTLLVRHRPTKRPQLRRELDVAASDIACAVARGQLAYYRLLEEQKQIRIITNQSDLKSHWSSWNQQTSPIGMIIAMEGADPIASPKQAEEWWLDGLRSVGLVHYGLGPYAGGTADTNGLTPAGVELLKEFDRLGMILDLTHCSDKSFFEAADRFSGEVMASHNNCRALVPGDRQFTDEQINLLLSRNAVIGVALDGWMLKPGFVAGQSIGHEIPLSAVVDHIDYICQLAGNTNHVAIGSDLDGGFGHEQTPAGVDSIADLHKLEPILRERGYSDADIDRIFHKNWLEFFARALPR